MSLLIALITAIAAARLTRLVIADDITKPFRNWVAAQLASRTASKAASQLAGQPAGKAATDSGPVAPPRFWRYLNKLVTCAWCSGFWISAAAFLGYFRFYLDTWPDSYELGFIYGATVFAASQFIGLANDWLDSPPPPRHLTMSLAPADITVRQPTGRR